LEKANATGIAGGPPMVAADPRGDARHVFLSHASGDAEMAMRICAALEQVNTKAWIAPRDIDPGKTYPVAIESGIRNSACVVVLLTERSNASAEVLKEIELSLSLKKPVVALSANGAKPAGGLAYHLASSQWLTWREDPRATAEEIIRFLQSVRPEAVGRVGWDSATRAVFPAPDVRAAVGEGTIIVDPQASGLARSTAPSEPDLVQRLTGEGRAPLAAGDRVGAYTIAELIGASDLSLTYRAERLGNRRQAVLRELLPKGVARREASAAPVKWNDGSSSLKKTRAALESLTALETRIARRPAMANLHLARECFKQMGTLYSARPFVAGANLTESLRSNGGKISANEAADLFKLLLGELAPLHAAGYLHGDIKPANVILSSGAGPKLIDFDGLLEVGKPRNAHLPILVSPGFSAPELVECSSNPTPRAFDASLDLYSLAATVYFCLAGRAPAPASVDQMIESLIREQFVPWRIGGALGWCLAGRPEARPRSAADVGAFLLG
jgi:hypothetical protein